LDPGPEKSAKPTIDNSPPIHRWDQGSDVSESVKRTAETPELSVVHFMDWGPHLTGYPALKCWATFNSPLRGLSQNELFTQS